MQNYRASLFCWIVLTVIIAGTLLFMINFYNKTVNEINRNSAVAHINIRVKAIQDIYVEE